MKRPTPERPVDESPPSARRRRTPIRHRRPPLALNLTPLIDVVFLMMSYFLVVADFRKTEDVLRLELPPVSGAAAALPSDAPADPFALPSRPIRVRVRSTGAGAGECVISSDSPLFPRASIGALEDLRSAMSESRGRVLDDDQRFIVEPAPGSRWDHVIAVMNAIQRAGFSRINLAKPGAAGP